MALVRRLGAADYALQTDEDTLLVAFDEGAVYGVELAFPESDEDAYRVDLLRTTRDQSGAERQQHLTLTEYASHMEAEEALMEAAHDLYERGRTSIAEHLPALAEQPADYRAGFMVVSYSPDTMFTDEPVRPAAMREK